MQTRNAFQMCAAAVVVVVGWVAGYAAPGRRLRNPGAITRLCCANCWLTSSFGGGKDEEEVGISQWSLQQPPASCEAEVERSELIGRHFSS